jgi:hypothetical protein
MSREAQIAEAQRHITLNENAYRGWLVEHGKGATYRDDAVRTNAIDLEVMIDNLYHDVR